MSDEQEITAPLEADDLQAGWAQKAALPAHPRCHAYLVCGAKTDLGLVRENNEDKFDSFEPDDPQLLAVKGRVYAVADGMGGHSAGQVASELALNVFIRSYFADRGSEIEAALRRAVREANAYVVDVARTVPGRNGMGATLTAGVVRDDYLYLAQVGDSRAYLLRDGQLRQMTEDHSWVAEQVRSGAMSLHEAEQSPFRNVITRSMGGAPEVDPDIYAIELRVGDRYLLCSDGLSGMVANPEIAELLGQGSPSSAAWNLVERANHYGGKDNITAFVLQVVEIVDWPSSDEELAEATEEGGEPLAPASNGHHAEAPFTVGSVPEGPAGQEQGGEPGGGKGGLMSRLFRKG